MTKIRWNWDYEKLIRDFGSLDDFDFYCNTHKISRRRAARAYCLKHDLVKFAEWRLIDFAFNQPEDRVYELHSTYLRS